MKILAKSGRKDIATVYIAEIENGKRIEFVESIQPPIPRDKKWVLIVSSLYGCPVNCRFCDAGGGYQGKLSKEDLLIQIDYLVKQYFPDNNINIDKFKIQFARMGEPAFNQNVLEVLKELPAIYNAPGLIPSISTIAPVGTEKFFDELLEIKEKYYGRKFQMQFSIHTTDVNFRDWLIPVKKWDFGKIAEYGNKFYKAGDRKITLNFALANNMPVNPQMLLNYFDPDKFLIKITPINPTFKAIKNNINSYILPEKSEYELLNELKAAGYDVILSIGELEENKIGSNCGQYLTTYQNNKESIQDSYTYQLEKV
ncbi:MAG: radical SAM protein [Candidatus Melainabacteria bacterium RIFOXYA12_FULL_32_12]|nr:MAG: radical SAM protein [Candidatus Melainabacteria bacterium RIFOXYA2_FULL_32_9]OGI24480.1 MAG: radical SAM protein [Candidatus Melainabacteria bacterium RIFOXYA12_FULL_32_12]